MIAAPPVYLDECVDYHLVAALRARGFVVRSALDHRMMHIDDEAQLTFATANGWMLLSHRDQLLFEQPLQRFMVPDAVLPAKAARAEGGSP